MLALASALVASADPVLILAADPPRDLIKLVARRETETEAHRSQYTYRQSVRMQEISDRGASRGEYRESRDVVFSADGTRTENYLEKPANSLQDVTLTDEDFQDIRNIQPLLLDVNLAPLYETHPRGDEVINGVDCWVLQIRPRQILQGQRLFDGMIWIKKDDYSVIQSAGQAVPQIRNMKRENLFPGFTTTRTLIDGYWFPSLTAADDVLDFRNGPLRIKLTIRYMNYKKFGSDTKVTFEK